MVIHGMLIHYQHQTIEMDAIGGTEVGDLYAAVAERFNLNYGGWSIFLGMVPLPLANRLGQYDIQSGTHYHDVRLQLRQLEPHLYTRGVRNACTVSSLLRSTA